MLNLCISSILSLMISSKVYFSFKIVKESFSLLDLISSFPCSLTAFICFSPWSLTVLICFSNVLPRREYVSLFFSITLLWSDGNAFSPVKASYLSILPYQIFAASWLILHCTFSSVTLSSVVMINFYILSKRLFLKSEELSDAWEVSITKKEYLLWYIFCKDS